MCWVAMSRALARYHVSKDCLFIPSKQARVVFWSSTLTNKHAVCGELRYASEARLGAWDLIALCTYSVSTPVPKRQVCQFVLFNFGLARSYRYVSMYRKWCLIGTRGVFLEVHQHLGSICLKELSSLKSSLQPVEATSSFEFVVVARNFVEYLSSSAPKYDDVASVTSSHT